MYKVKGFKKLTDYAEALGVAVPENDCEINSIKFDSRIAAKGDLFIPLEGSKFNGEDFVKTALTQGAAAITKQNLGGLVLHNHDVYQCLLTLAKNNLQNIRPKIIFITGSYGKTTIKDMLKHFLGNKCHCSKENENNEFGIPYTILSMPLDTEFLVVECGARKKNDFDLISKKLFCDIFILTAITDNHLESFGDLRAIIETKLKLRESLINKENFIDGRKISENNFELHNKRIINSTMKILKMNDPLDYDSFKPTKGRGNKINRLNGKIIDQSYNAHPKTVYETASMQDPNITTLILGDMAELGKNEINIHADLLIKLKKFEIYVTGNIYKEAIKLYKLPNVRYFSNLKEFPKETLVQKLKDGKNLYFKGSRSSKMEQYLNLLLND